MVLQEEQLFTTADLKERRAFMKLSVDERRRILALQADEITEHYESETEAAEREPWQGGDIVDY